MRRWLLLMGLVGAPAWATSLDPVILLQEAIQQDPRNVQLRVDLARLLSPERDDPQRCEEAWKDVLKLDPRHVEAYLGLGGLYEAGEKMAEAIQAYEKAVELDPVREMAYVRLANLKQYQVDHPGEAEKVLRACLAKVPQAVSARLSLADILLEKGQHEETKRLYEDANRLEPALPEPWVGLMAVAAIRGQEGQWETLHRAWLAVKPDASPDVLFFLTAQKLPEGQEGVKEKLLRRAIALSPADKAPYGALAVVLGSLRRDHDLRQLYQDMMTRFPEDPFAYSQMGMLHMESEKFAEAERAFIQLVSKAPEDPFSYLSLTEALVKQGKKADARRWLREGLQKLPDDPILQDALKGL